jgi:hypothetical protein
MMESMTDLIDITIDTMIAARRRLWDKYRDEKRDRELCEAAAAKIVEVPSLQEEVERRPYNLIECLFSIVDKKGNLVPFFFNTVQKSVIAELDRIWDTGGSIYTLKGRQQGITTLISAVQLCVAVVYKHWRGMTIADCETNTLAIFKDKGKVHLDRMPQAFKPTVTEDNAQSLTLGKLDNSWSVATATAKVGRSRTLNFLHLSEIAFYSVPLADIQSAVGQALTPTAITVYETTANGYNEAKRLWDSGVCCNLFYEWWLSEEYTDSYTGRIAEARDSWIINKIAWLRERGISDGQIAWYVKKYGELGKDKLMQEYPCTAEEAFVSSGECYFNLETLSTQQNVCPKPSKVGDFSIAERDGPTAYVDGELVHTRPAKWELTERLNGYIRIFTEPVYGRPYVIGADTADSGSDKSTAYVLDNGTGEQVAEIHGKLDERHLTEQLYCLGMYYNTALIAIETNCTTYHVNALQDWDYPKQYMREVEDQITHKIQQKFGFKTTTLTRDNILAGLRDIARDYPNLIKSRWTIGEMMTFVRNNAGRYEAQEKEHDDLVMAAAIAYYTRTQQDYTAKRTPDQVPQTAAQFLFNTLGIKISNKNLRKGL